MMLTGCWVQPSSFNAPRHFRSTNQSLSGGCRDRGCWPSSEVRRPGGDADAIVAIAKAICFPMATEALIQAQAIPLEEELIDVIGSAAKYSPTHKLKGGHEKPGVPCTAAAKKPTTSLVASPKPSFWLLAA